MLTKAQFIEQEADYHRLVLENRRREGMAAFRCRAEYECEACGFTTTDAGRIYDHKCPPPPPPAPPLPLLEAVRAAMAPYGYTLTDEGHIVTPDGKDTAVDFVPKGKQAQIRLRYAVKGGQIHSGGKLLWSGAPNLAGGFLAAFWGARRSEDADT